MNFTIIRLSPIQILVIYLIAACKFLENNYINQDGIYKYKFSNNVTTCHYLVNNLEVCVFKSGIVMVVSKGIVKGLASKPKDPIGIMLYKTSYEDPKVKGYVHKIRIYSNGVIIHTSKLFKYIYRLEGDTYMRRIFWSKK